MYCIIIMIIITLHLLFILFLFLCVEVQVPAVGILGLAIPLFLYFPSIYYFLHLFRVSFKVYR